MALGTVQAVIVDDRPGDYRAVSDACPEHVHLHLLGSGRAALQFVSSEPVQLWLINIHLPDTAGVDLLASLRPRHGGARWYLVANRYHAEEERQARGAGAAGYLCKPPQAWWLDLVQDGKRGDDGPGKISKLKR